MPTHKSSRRESKRREAQRKRRRQKEEVVALVKDVAIASVIVVIVMTSLYVYSGFIWPPMVVVESGSMMHSDDSAVGIIDTGDLTIVKKVNGRRDIVTYVEARADLAPVSGKHHNYKTYGDYGDVIIYEKNGLSGTPVIHRAMMWVEYNESCSRSGRQSADIPDLGVHCIQQYTIPDADYHGRDLTVDFNTIFNSEHSRHDGFLTHGDNNQPIVDQASLQDKRGRLVSPVETGWIVGKSEGELPWFGIIKLLASGAIKSDDVPSSSWTGLIGSIVLIVTVPLAIDLILHFRNKSSAKKKKLEKGEEDDGTDEDDDNDDEPPKKMGDDIHKKKRGSKALDKEETVSFDVNEEMEKED